VGHHSQTTDSFSMAPRGDWIDIRNPGDLCENFCTEKVDWPCSQIRADDLTFNSLPPPKVGGEKADHTSAAKNYPARIFVPPTSRYHGRYTITIIRGPFG